MSEQVRLSIAPGKELQAAGGEHVPIMVSVAPPDGAQRCPVDICCVVDVSGSMGTEAMLKGEDGSEVGHGLSVLDIVKHALKTIIHNLGDTDRLALVAYSNDAQIIFNLTVMTPNGRSETERRLDELSPSGMTNLWDGLKTGMDVLSQGAGQGERLQHVMLFTDGLPNINPPRGILPMLKRLKDKGGGKLPCAINTFGFGYELDSELLSQLAADGSGAYAFIPDPGFVGTVFVNSMANLLVTMGKDVVLTLEPTEGATIGFVAGGHPVTKKPDGSIAVGLGSLQFGQAKEVIVSMTVPQQAVAAGFLKASLAYGTRSQNEQVVSCVGRGSGAAGTSRAVEMSRVRLKFVDTVRAAMQAVKLSAADKAKGRAMPLESAQSMLAELAQEMQSSAALREEGEDGPMAGLLEDLTGQVAEAFSREDWYTKWGVHYIPSLMFAHLTQQCNNFKDVGVQVYGGDLFGELRDKADEVFLALPAPTPSARRAPAAPPVVDVSSRTGYSAPAPAPTPMPINMAAFHDRFAGCIAGDSTVLMADGTERRVDEIRKGDAVSALADTGLAEVACVVRTRVPGGRLALAALPGGLRATAFHPVWLDGAWRFPADVADVEEQACEAVYTFVLEEGARAVLVNGVPCVPLGHGVEEGAARHPFLGSRDAVRALEQLPGYDSGLVDLGGACRAVRDPDTGLVCGFAQL
mmetsp:Transcript_66933/g.180984  ORF Transcript_66933/g.180984 Transcript_66933/m.180984 type:complete len:692 (+) Transcript_66933:97-2172(+)